MPVGAGDVEYPLPGVPLDRDHAVDLVQLDVLPHHLHRLRIDVHGVNHDRPGRLAIMMANGPTPENMSITVSPSLTREAIRFRSFGQPGVEVDPAGIDLEPDAVLLVHRLAAVLAGDHLQVAHPELTLHAVVHGDRAQPGEGGQQGLADLLGNRADSSSGRRKMAMSPMMSKDVGSSGLSSSGTLARDL